MVLEQVFNINDVFHVCQRVCLSVLDQMCVLEFVTLCGVHIAKLLLTASNSVWTVYYVFQHFIKYKRVDHAHIYMMEFMMIIAKLENMLSV